MKRNLKKILAVTLSMAMLTTSVTVNNIVTKADDNAGVAVMADDGQNVKTVTFNSIAIRADKNGIDASWNIPDGLVYKTDYTNVRIYIRKVDDVDREYSEDDYAVASNGHVFSENYDKDTTYNNQTAVDTVVRNKANTINVYDGNQYVVVVKYVNGTNVVAEGTSNSIAYDNKELNPEKSFNEDAKTMTIKWNAIVGSKKYVVKSGQDVVATVTDMFTKQITVNYEEDKEYTLTVEAYGDEDTLITTADIEKFISPKTTNAAISGSVVKGVGIITWKAITYAKQYRVYIDGVEKETVTGLKYTLNDMKEDNAYAIKIEALDSEGNVIEINNNEIKLIYSTTEKAPAENDISKVDTSSWTKLNVKKGTVDSDYYVNGAHGLSTAVWWGIYAPHSEADYHGERTKCELGDASAFVFNFTPNNSITAIWVNGTKYENPSMYFNHQGDCAEISTSVFDQEENVVTLVYTQDNTEKMKTFAVKKEKPLKPDATKDVTQDIIDKDSITEWTKLTGESANGSIAYISTASVDKLGDAGLRGFYDAGNTPRWNHINEKLDEVSVFGIATKGENPSSIIIDGKEYINSKDKNNEKVYIGGDCVYIEQSLIETESTTVSYHTITLVDNPIGTFLVKVVGKDAPKEPDAPFGIVEDENNPYAFTWGDSGNGVTYVVYLDNEKVAEVNELRYDISEYVRNVAEFEAGTHVFALATKNDAGESSKITVNFEVGSNTVKIGNKEEQVVYGRTFTFPTDATGYDLNGELYAPGSKYTVTKDVTFEAVDIKATMDTRAGIRFSKDNPGLRFQTTITATKAGNATTDFEKYISEEGTLITTSELNTEKGNPTIESDSVYTVGKDLIQIKNNGWYNGQTGVYYGSVVGIKSYTTNFIARSYVAVKYADGTVKNIYSDMSGVRTVQHVAQAIKNDKRVNETTGKTYYESLSEANKLIVDEFAGTETSTEQ